MVQTFSLLERYLKKKHGPTFQKQLSDFMETSKITNCLTYFAMIINHWRGLELKQPLRMSDIEFQFYEDYKRRRIRKCVVSTV